MRGPDKIVEKFEPLGPKSIFFTPGVYEFTIVYPGGYSIVIGERNFKWYSFNFEKGKTYGWNL